MALMARLNSKMLRAKPEASGSTCSSNQAIPILYHRQRDDVEVFTIKKDHWPEYWLSHPGPVMLVIRTSDGKIRWMNITEYLKRHGADTKQVVFEGGSVYRAECRAHEKQNFGRFVSLELANLNSREEKELS